MLKELAIFVFFRIISVLIPIFIQEKINLWALLTNQKGEKGRRRTALEREKNQKEEGGPWPEEEKKEGGDSRFKMLSKTNRLKRKKDIENVFKRGRGFKEGFLILKIIKNNLKNSRFAFVISRKISRKATLRNKIKRKLSELVRLKIKRVKGGMDFIFVAVPGLEEKDFWEINETINKLFQKAKCLEE